MEWHHLEYFKLLAKLQNVSLSAKQLNVSQSALSRAIKQLEEEVGAPLFNRVGRSLKLNKYGQSFLVTVNMITQEMDMFKSEVTQSIDMLNGDITIGFLHSVGPTYLSDFLKTFNSQYPNIRVKLLQDHAKGLISKLESGDIDVAITMVAPASNSVCFIPLLQEQLFITLNSTHPLANEQSLNIADLVNEQFILLKENFVLREQVDQIFYEHNINNVEINFESDETLTIASFVSAGLGISILPKLKNIQLPNLTQIPINNYKAQRTIGLCYLTQADQLPIVKVTKETLLNYFSNYNEGKDYNNN
ncbi:LysR family transcriptional regulator [Staphylococcus kloosii]|uniref:HTH-type transcriptional regulator YybE n=1 Tax=Staphylococcus kloosii TaxID=29384 RepID=A0ABQ0XQV3_9STAP|nr:LysR family transcriptional regulator [Staphylococcus kloosii]AVQ35113.1 LysR family transcriptional regulator [Staphylococcus kloosii]PNZ08210.1 LysR family transcriptional regulator [Staphylococcus kloosii]GEP81550.1 putative HTH-type transcriptional regulator YybE [Staphylococcus kloosii]SUM48155.1 transcriptional regulator [Staphylococcus kloosii]